MHKNPGKGVTFENNTPVGSAGQPTGKSSNPRMDAIKRRLAKKNSDSGKTN